MLFLVFKSAEYGKIRKVVDTDTLEERKTKKKGKRMEMKKRHAYL